MAYANTKGYILFRARSKKRKTDDTSKVWLACAHGGEYKNKRKDLTNDNRKRKCSSRISRCSFSMTLQRCEVIAPAASVTYELRVFVVQGEHKNHDGAGNLYAYPTARKLKAIQKSSIHTLSKAGIASKLILISIRQSNPSCVLIPQDIYNAKATIQNKILAGRTSIKMLRNELHTKNICHAHDMNNGGYATHLYLARDQFVKFANEFLHMIQMDCTYKSNKFKMPLRHIVGMSSTNESYSVVLCFLSFEVEADYIWELEQFASIFAMGRLPEVIVTNHCDESRIGINVNHLRNIFLCPQSSLCLAHPEESILDTKSFNANWTDMLAKHTQQACNYTYPTWFTHKERFILAWTKVHCHLGNLVTSHAEGKYGALKTWITVSSGNLTDTYQSNMLSISQQETVIKEMCTQ
ncbi:hypothetical protein Mp_3g00250 [Marchantia polymorpha subsp. ruderalis]|uniref:MULE transposase domain-containing protein n=2 Tax=Marchantia polymorpha TaxID=3197 RepID=A0AAF6AVU0_MARPO|nr:hypothetical protein MARPO_0007s0022 [Marchantia polymorpha]BBN03874.1 hypothetical protein Mp_3g00250 [Marchantia polymorpha subsp. ruderalis]|eukprot:PTQ47563.1 hypothetical protein MARPO_0007s0022 [Marchantia polymorpha]